MEESTRRSYEYELVPQHNNDNTVGVDVTVGASGNSVSVTDAAASAIKVSTADGTGVQIQRESQHTMTESGSKIKEYIAAFAGNIAAFTTGICLTWTAPSNPKLSGEHWAEQSPLPEQLTAKETAWISSLLPLAAALGPLFSGYIADKIGRKYTLLLAGIPFIVGFILLATAHNLPQIFIARFLWGLALGPVFTVLPMYIGEIASPDIRGALGSLMQLFITFGILWSAAIGPYVGWAEFNYISMGIPIAFMIIFFFMPESPYYLMGKDNKDAACESLMFLRSKTQEGVQKELEQIRCSVDESKKQTGTVKDLFATSGRRKALLISIGLVTFQQLSGINAVLFSSNQIFIDAGSSNPDMSSIIIAIVQVGASAITPFVVDRLGRRILLTTSGIGMTIGLFALGLYFFFKGDDPDGSSGSNIAEKISWLPVASLVIYMLVYCTGFGPLPWAVMGEIFPSNIKSLASTATASFCWILGFFITQYFEQVSNSVGKDMSFWFFSVMCILATLFVQILMPETKGKSLDEIQSILEGHTKK